MRPSRYSGAWLAMVVLLSLSLAGCRKVPPVTADHESEAAFWEIPRESLGQQWLFRSKVQAGDDTIRLRIALRLAGPEDFELDALDSLGRRQWSMRAENQFIVWIDHRERTACRMVDATALPESLPIPIPPSALARVLLGRAPREPVSRVDIRGNLRIYEDAQGERWNVTVDGLGQPEAWSGHDLDGHDLSWTRESEEFELVVEEMRVRVRWKAVAREALRGMLIPLAVPEGYSEIDCARGR